MLKVYLETSFFSACVWTREDAQSQYWRQESRRWWVHQRAKFDIFICAEVVRELSSPGFWHREEALSLASEAQLLPITDEVKGTGDHPCA